MGIYRVGRTLGLGLLVFFGISNYALEILPDPVSCDQQVVAGGRNSSEDTTHPSLYHFKTSHVELVLSLLPNSNNNNRAKDRLSEFALRYRPALVPYPTALSSIFGRKPLNLDIKNIRFFNETFTSRFNGGTYKLTLQWLDQGIKKSAVVHFSDQTGDIIFYPGIVQSERSDAVHEARVLMTGLMAEATANVWRPVGKWYRQEDLTEMDLTPDGPVAPPYP